MIVIWNFSLRNSMKSRLLYLAVVHFPSVRSCLCKFAWYTRQKSVSNLVMRPSARSRKHMSDKFQRSPQASGKDHEICNRPTFTMPRPGNASFPDYLAPAGIYCSEFVSRFSSNIIASCVLPSWWFDSDNPSFRKYISLWIEENPIEM